MISKISVFTVLFSLLCYSSYGADMQDILLDNVQAGGKQKTDRRVTRTKRLDNCVSSDFEYVRLAQSPSEAKRASVRNLLLTSSDKSATLNFLHNQTDTFAVSMQEYLIDYSTKMGDAKEYSLVFARHSKSSREVFADAIANLNEPSIEVFFDATLYGLSADKMKLLLGKGFAVNLQETYTSVSDPFYELADAKENLLSVAIRTANIELIKFWHQQQLEFISTADVPIYHLVAIAAKSYNLRQIEQLIDLLVDLGQAPDELSLFYISQLRTDLIPYLAEKFGYSNDKSNKKILALDTEYLALQTKFKHLVLKPTDECKYQLLWQASDNELTALLPEFQKTKMMPARLKNIERERFRLLFPEQTIVRQLNKNDADLMFQLYQQDPANILTFVKQHPKLIKLQDWYSRDIRYLAAILEDTGLMQYLSQQNLSEYPDKEGPNPIETAILYHPDNIELQKFASIKIGYKKSH